MQNKSQNQILKKSRREFLAQSSSLTILGLSTIGFFPNDALAQGGSLKDSIAAKNYDPKAKFEIDIKELEFRKNANGRQLMARIYQPKGSGPFPVLLDLHGGAWNRKNRTAEQPMNRSLASSGILVVAIDMSLAGDMPYPACFQDAHYGVRWLKFNAHRWQGDPSTIGIYGSSSGGHAAELIGMKPFDPVFSAIPFPENPNLDATVRYVASRAPISDPFARYQNAVARARPDMIKNHHIFFHPWEKIYEANPQQILDRHEKVSLPPLLIMAGALDDNVLPAIQERFAKSYQAAGGDCELKIFANSEHEWVAEESLQTDLARLTVKNFIYKQLHS
ncbi:MAG: alpha/beta hydrolase [Betaproteobacteria bacterium]|jgi:acetyl esterase/lipase